jgi:hypothetical protein
MWLEGGERESLSRLSVSSAVGVLVDLVAGRGSCLVSFRGVQGESRYAVGLVRSRQAGGFCRDVGGSPDLRTDQVVPPTISSPNVMVSESEEGAHRPDRPW